MGANNCLVEAARFASQVKILSGECSLLRLTMSIPSSTDRYLSWALESHDEQDLEEGAGSRTQTELSLKMALWPMSLWPMSFCVARSNKAEERLHDVLFSIKGSAPFVCLGGVSRGLAD